MAGTSINAAESGFRPAMTYLILEFDVRHPDGIEVYEDIDSGSPE